MMNETEKDLPLRHDLARLDRLLAEIVREQEGEAVYHEMRTIPVEAHDRVGTPELSRRLAELSPAAAAARMERPARDAGPSFGEALLRVRRAGP